MVGSNRHERSKMSEMDPKGKAAPEVAASEMFVPKQDGKTELTLDESLLKIAELFKQFGPMKKQLENLKQVAKAHLKAQGKKQYQMMNGIKAQFIDSQKPVLNKELAKELCGARWAEVEKFNTVTSFKVTVPGVKSPDAD